MPIFGRQGPRQGAGKRVKVGPINQAAEHAEAAGRLRVGAGHGQQDIGGVTHFYPDWKRAWGTVDTDGISAYDSGTKTLGSGYVVLECHRGEIVQDSGKVLVWNRAGSISSGAVVLVDLVTDRLEVVNRIC